MSKKVERESAFKEDLHEQKTQKYKWKQESSPFSLSMRSSNPNIQKFRYSFEKTQEKESSFTQNHLNGGVERKMKRAVSSSDIQISGFKTSDQVSSQSFLLKPTDPTVLAPKVPQAEIPLKSEEIISKQQIEAYSKVFDDIIKQDSLYGVLLASIKQTYDEYIFELSEENFDTKIKTNEIDKTTETINELNLEISDLKKELKFKEAESLKIMRDSELKTQKLEDEIKDYREALENANKEFRTARIRESKYIKLIGILKEEGIPVDEFYTMYVKRQPGEREPRKFTNRSSGDYSTSDRSAGGMSEKSSGELTSRSSSSHNNPNN